MIGLSFINHSSQTVTLVASECLLANVSAMRMGNTIEAYVNIFVNLASRRNLAQVYASEIFAPESLPSS